LRRQCNNQFNLFNAIHIKYTKNRGPVKWKKKDYKYGDRIIDISITAISYHIIPGLKQMYVSGHYDVFAIKKNGIKTKVC